MEDWLFDLRHRKRMTVSQPLWDNAPVELVAVTVREWETLLDLVEGAMGLVEELRALKEVAA